jgi:hypothetical protein
MKLGAPIKFEYTDRYFQFSRQFAIRDVFDALEELITNSDDSYHRLYKKQLRSEDGGSILVEINEQRKGKPSSILVHDKAEGMILVEMRDGLRRVGGHKAEDVGRGFMGRGAKDCTELGKMIYESIKDEKYYKCELTPSAEFIPWVDGRSVDKEIRNRLGIERGNGTVITLEITSQYRIPHVDTIIRDLPWHYALRDILSENSASRVVIRNLNSPDKKIERIVYRQPEAELVCNESFDVPNYPNTIARLEICKAPEPFDDPADRRFRRSGLIIKGERAIYGCSLLCPGFEKDPYAMRYFGRLECEYIDTLLNEYDKRLKNNEPHPSENPSLLIDPNRKEGLMPEHPFTKALFQIPIKRLQELINKDREQDRSERREIVSEETKDRLNQLAKAASKFLSDQIEEIEELTAGDKVDEEAFSKQGVLIFPTYLNIALGEIRTLTYYVNRTLFEAENKEVIIKTDDSAISILDGAFKLRKHPKKSDKLLGSFRIRGEKIKDKVVIEALCADIPLAKAEVKVIPTRFEEHEFIFPLEFEHKLYHVKGGSQRTLRLFAKCPELVNAEVLVNIVSSDSESVPVRGRCHLVPIPGSNYALGEVVVQGKRLKKESVNITATLNGNQTSTKVKVTQKEETKVQIEIDLRDEDYGNFRARWAEHEGKPNLLLISARHDSIKRYLGPSPGFEGQKMPHFRVLLAEIVTESICRKSLLLEAKGRPWEFRWADFKEDRLIADAVLAQIQKRIRNFAAVAHEIMLRSTEIKIIQER